MQLLSAIILNLPPTQLHLVPELLSEAVLGTKELNERARNAGFDLLVVMANKMAQGGTVKSQVRPVERNGDAMEEDEETQAAPRGDVNASVEEFITMVAAGLTSTTPHMISASISALTRLVFEFKGKRLNRQAYFRKVLTRKRRPDFPLLTLRARHDSRRLPVIEQPRSGQIRTWLHQTPHHHCPFRHRDSPFTGPRSRFAGLGTRPQESFQAEDCTYF